MSRAAAAASLATDPPTRRSGITPPAQDVERDGQRRWIDPE
jgi:hypothetical protein